MNKQKSSKCILFLYEGATDKLFYQQVFKEKWQKKVPLITKEMGSGGNFNKIVARLITDFLISKEHKNKENIYIFVAIDRDGTREIQPIFDEKFLKNEFKNEKRIKEIQPIVATQDVESWFFIDIESIFKFLGVSLKTVNLAKYINHENYSSKHLSELFQKHKKENYYKGNSANGLISQLNILKIHDNCKDLEKGILTMNTI